MKEDRDRFKFGKDLIILDVETTGADYRLFSIAELGAVRVDQYSLSEESSFETLVRPYRTLFDPVAMSIHKIEKEALLRAPRLYDCLVSFENWIRETTSRKFRAHHPLRTVGFASWGHFDVPFLQEAYRYLLRDWPYDYNAVDIKSIARWESAIKADPFKYGVDEISKRLGIIFEGQQHRALSDARQVSKVLRELRKQALFEREVFYD